MTRKPPNEKTRLYDVHRLAKLLGVERATIRTIGHRGKLPEPTATNTNGGAIWSKKVIQKFCHPEEKP